MSKAQKCRRYKADETDLPQQPSGCEDKDVEGERSRWGISVPGKLNTSHRYNLLPLLPSGPGGIQRELVVYDLPVAKVIIFS